MSLIHFVERNPVYSGRPDGFGVGSLLVTSSNAVHTDDLSALLADLQKRRRELEKNLDDTDRSQKSTRDLIDKIVEMKVRAAKMAADNPTTKG